MQPHNATPEPQLLGSVNLPLPTIFRSFCATGNIWHLQGNWEIFVKKQIMRHESFSSDRESLCSHDSCQQNMCRHG
jgi:hypothetical protein